MSRYVVALCGPNAVGKTTAARRWAVRHPSVTYCLCDIQKVIESGVERREDLSWKKDRAALVNRYSGFNGLLLVESASGYGLRIAEELKADSWIMLTCSPEAHLRHLRVRAERSGKKFREDFWLRAAGYEAERRITNYAAAKLGGVEWRRFVVDDLKRDWREVDWYFTSLLRERGCSVA